MYSRLSFPSSVNRDRVRGDGRRDQGYARSPNWCGLSSCQLPKKYNYRHHQKHDGIHPTKCILVPMYFPFCIIHSGITYWKFGHSILYLKLIQKYSNYVAKNHKYSHCVMYPTIPGYLTNKSSLNTECERGEIQLMKNRLYSWIQQQYFFRTLGFSGGIHWKMILPLKYHLRIIPSFSEWFKP